MGLQAVAEKLGRIDALDALTGPAAKVVKQVVGPGPVKDLLSGSWLGESLHPPMTDIPIGLLSSATLLDLLAPRRAQGAADTLVAVGVLSALPTAAAGWADWSDSYGEDMRVGIVHALSVGVGLGLYATSLGSRRRGHRAVGTALGLAGMTSMAVGGYLGGYLSHSRGLGVNHAFLEHPPSDWTAVLAEAELAPGAPKRVDAGGAAVLLYRTGERIYAIGNSCSHAGGPLSEGDVDEAACTVTCPWHQSVFRLADGGVVHGPAAVPQTAYETRVSDGQIEVRRST